MNLGDPFPNFKAKTTRGDIEFHEWIGESWAILFSHPAGKHRKYCAIKLKVHRLVFCRLHSGVHHWTGESCCLGSWIPAARSVSSKLNKPVAIFTKNYFRKLIALSCDSVASHLGWIKDIQAYGNQSGDFPYPIIDDANRELAVKFNMLDKDEIGAAGLPLTCRAVFIIDPLKRLRTSILYPASTGRNFDEILRVVDALQLTDRNKVATPVDWKKGEWCMVLPTVKDEEIPALYPKGVDVTEMPSGKKYIRKTPCPESCQESKLWINFFSNDLRDNHSPVKSEDLIVKPFYNCTIETIF